MLAAARHRCWSSPGIMGEGGTGLKPLGDVIERVIWSEDLARLPTLRALGMRMLRTTYALVNDIRDGQLTLHAMSLVYTRLLSLVPLLALSFSVLKGFGVHIQPSRGMMAHSFLRERRSAIRWSSRSVVVRMGRSHWA